MTGLSPEQFVEKWQNTPLKERQSYQLHFVDVCRLVGHAPPDGSGVDERGKKFVFERAVKKDSGKQGFADVWYEDHFAIEYKGSGEYKDLKDAYDQLRQYRENLKNPPLLIVTDIDHWEIHTNWPNTDKKAYTFTHQQLLEPGFRRLLRHIFDAPEQLHPDRNTEQVTVEAAAAFKAIVDNMRHEWQAEPEAIARFLTKLVFSLFAEDIGLLPATTDGKGLFTEIVDQTRHQPDDFRHYMQQLFAAMRDGGKVMFRDIPYFNGALFEDVNVARLSFDALNELDRACHLNWSSVEPAVFGTLFERTLDPAKRAQLGAHYTSPADIELILEPVLMQPLRRGWEAVQAEALPLRGQYDAALAGGTTREQTRLADALEQLRAPMLERLRTIRVLDPACGSGNFLYLSLRLLMTLEKEVIKSPLWSGLPEPQPQVHPRQMYGMEKDEIAHDLASIVVWIGYLQWREENGYLPDNRPVLEDLGDNIRRMDAIMNEDGTEPDWPKVNVIVGNPPFLGGNRIRAELGNTYVDRLFKLYQGRVPAFADLVTYWFEKARDQIMSLKAGRAGLLATNSIRGGVNREVLTRIKYTGDIFMAWSDREWVLDGAAVRVSIVGFDNASSDSKTLDGLPVATINADLTADIDLTQAIILAENLNIQFEGTKKGASFDIPYETAQKMLNAINKSGFQNSDVIRPWVNGLDIVRTPSNTWIIDFGTNMPIEKAQLYEQPFAYVISHVKPKYGDKRRNWWLHERTRPEMRKSLDALSRYIVTARVAKHRLYVWLPKSTLPDSQVVAFARDDDYFFGVLHSRLHEIWSLRMGTSLEDRPRYTPTTTFETFPFPWPPGQEDTDSPAYRAVSAAAKQLHEERAAWLNPTSPPTLARSLRSLSTRGEGESDSALKSLSTGGEGFRVRSEISEKALKDRTLTKLYNALQDFRKTGIPAQPGDFAPRLAELHDALDKAVCDAYGWPHEVLADDEDILRRLLALNQERAAAQDAPPPQPPGLADS